MTGSPAQDEGELDIPLDGLVESAAGPAAAAALPGLLSPEEVAARLRELPGWRPAAHQRAIEQSFEFPSYQCLARFVHLVVSLAAVSSCYPELNVGRDRVEVRIVPPDSGGWRGPALDFAATLNRFEKATAPARTGREEGDGPGEDERGATGEEAANAQASLGRVAEWVGQLDRELRDVLASLPAVEEDATEEMEEGARPQSLAHHLRATLECLLADHLTPLHADLERAAATTADQLLRAWEEERGE